MSSSHLLIYSFTLLPFYPYTHQRIYSFQVPRDRIVPIEDPSGISVAIALTVAAVIHSVIKTINAGRVTSRDMVGDNAGAGGLPVTPVVKAPQAVVLSLLAAMDAAGDEAQFAVKMQAVEPEGFVTIVDFLREFSEGF